VVQSVAGFAIHRHTARSKGGPQTNLNGWLTEWVKQVDHRVVESGGSQSNLIRWITEWVRSGGSQSGQIRWITEQLEPVDHRVG